MGDQSPGNTKASLNRNMDLWSLEPLGKKPVLRDGQRLPRSCLNSRKGNKVQPHSFLGVCVVLAHGLVCRKPVFGGLGGKDAIYLSLSLLF